MYILKNALKSITRTKARNILIGIIITVIATSCCIALSIKNSAVKLIDSYEDSYDVEATLTLDRSSLRGDMRKQQGEGSTTTPQDFMTQIPEIDIDMVKNYGTSEYVKDYYYNVHASLSSTTIEKATQNKDDSSNNMPSFQTIKPDMATSQGQKSQGDFTMIGYSSIDGMKDFVEGYYKITSGEIFDVNDTANPCVISEDLAEENELKVGDEITMVNPSDETKTYVFKIVGIYSDSSESDEFSMFSPAANQIITNYISLNNIIEDSKDNETSKLSVLTDATFNLVSSDVVDSFKEDLKEKGLSSYYTVSTNLDSLEESLSPIENLSTFANTFLFIVLAIGGVILIVINMINIRERKYEIGVLRCIGMKKPKVLLQFVIELFIVTFISITIGTVIGSLLSVPVANNILAKEITSTEESQNQVNGNFGMVVNDSKGQGMVSNTNPQKGGDIRNVFGSSDVEYIDKINAVIDMKTVGELVLIGIVLTLVSSSISMVFISRYTPLKILSNRT